MPKTTKNGRREAIDDALAAVRHGDSDRFLSLVRPIEPLSARSDAPEELFLAAEAAYQRGRYPEAIDLFQQFAALPRREALPNWQRYIAAHRRSFAAIELGAFAEARTALRQAEEILESDQALEARRSDLRALRGHFLEYQGDFEGARAAFILAYDHAVAHSHWQRATTAASDLGRIYGIIGRPADGRSWLDRASDAANRTATAKYVLETIDLRRALLLAAMAIEPEALAVYNRILADPRVEGALYIDTRMRRADLHRVRGRFDDAEADLRAALDAATERHLRRHRVYCHKDLASLLIERGNEAGAAAEFGEALRDALALVPPPLLILIQLGDDALTEPRLTGRAALPPAMREQLPRVLNRLKELKSTSIYQKATRDRARERAGQELMNLLTKLASEDMIILAHCRVRTGAGRVEREGEKTTHIGPGETATLRCLLDTGPEGLTTNQLAIRRDVTLAAATKSLNRLRQAIGKDLTIRRRGPTRLYAVHSRSTKAP
jgi:tetratricopeptide (TPR) repeat protein